MHDPVLPLSRPAGQALGALHEALPVRAYPAWRLLLAAAFMTAAALTGAVVVIFGAPGAVDQGAAQSGAVRMVIAR